MGDRAQSIPLHWRRESPLTLPSGHWAEVSHRPRGRTAEITKDSTVSSSNDEMSVGLMCAYEAFSAAMQPSPEAVTAWRNLRSLTSPAANEDRCHRVATDRNEDSIGRKGRLGGPSPH